MIALLRGRLAAAAPGNVVLDCAGVGYRVLVPVGTPLPAAGAELTLHTHLAVREDAMTLYGFADADARDLFEVLLHISGVGPKLALAAIGTLGAGGLRKAVSEEDVVALTAVPGVGRKSAQRIVLELAGRLAVRGAAAGSGAPAPREEVREALAALGYGQAETVAALQALPDDPHAGSEELLRLALRALDGTDTAGNGRRPKRRGA